MACLRKPGEEHDIGYLVYTRLSPKIDHCQSARVNMPLLFLLKDSIQRAFDSVL